MVIKIFVLYMVLIDVLVDSYATKKSKTNFKKNEICEMDEFNDSYSCTLINPKFACF